MSDRGWIAPTNYPAPFALVLRGGVEPGKRPMTRMAFITEAIARHGLIVGFRGLIGSNTLTGWTRHPRPIEPEAIVRTWRSRPSAAAIRKARLKLPKTERVAP